MERALVIVTPSSRPTELVREAGELAAGVDAELVVAGVQSEDTYENAVDDISAGATAGRTLTIGQAEEGAKYLAEEVAAEALADLDVAYRAVGTVGREPNVVLDLAAELDCDHLFLVGRRRSPAGKLLSGDHTQRLLLAFDGPVTVLLDD